MASKSAIKGRAKGTGGICKIDNRFYFRISISGKIKHTLLRNSDDTPCRTRQEAETAAKLLVPIMLADQKEQIAVYVAEAKRLRKHSGLLLANAWETYLKQPNRPTSAESTLKNHHGTFNQFLAWRANTNPSFVRVAEVDDDIVREFFSDFWSTGISAKRYNDVLISLRLIFRHLMVPAALEKNPFEVITKKTQEISSRKEFTPEQITQIFEGFDHGFFYNTKVRQLSAGAESVEKETRLEFKPMHKDQMRVLLHLCCWTGCRGQDGCLMEWSNVDRSHDRISFVPRKTARKSGGRVVSLPLHPNLKTALALAESWRNENTDNEDYILPAVAKRYKNNPSGIQQDVKKIIHCATGLEPTTRKTHGQRKLAANAYSLHSFRHSFVSFCANSGVPLAVVAEIVGHGNPAMTRHYSHITTAAKAEAIAALPELKQIDSAKCNENEMRVKLITLIEHLPFDKLEPVIKFIQEQGNEI